MSAPTVRVKREAMLGGLVCHVAEDFERRFKTSALVELVGAGAQRTSALRGRWRGWRGQLAG